MPKSKKPRKKHVPKRTAIPIFYQHEEKRVRRMFANAEIATDIKLPRGECSEDDLGTIRDCLNTGNFIAQHRRDELDPQRFCEMMKALHEAWPALDALTDRGKANGGRFVCTADELKKIPLALFYVTDIVNLFLETQPGAVVDEHNGALLLRDTLPKDAIYSADDDVISFAYMQARGAAFHLHDFLAEIERAKARLRKKLKGRIERV